MNKFKTKSELANAAISALKFVEKQGTCTIVEFKSDYESIHKCHKLTSYLDENGIKFSPSTPHRHEQNGIAERVIQTLLRKMRANLKQCGLSNHFWCYALDAAVFVYNRTLHGATNKIPSMEFSKESVQLDSLVVFGCIGVCHIDEEKRSSRHDIDRATLVRMLGYDEHNRDGTYLVCDLKGKTFRARVTKWCEDVYSFAEMLKQLPIKKPRNRRHVANADEQLRRDEAKLREEIECEEKQEKDTERRVSRSNRIRKNRLRFIPGVNYAPMMHHMNALLDADAKDCSGTHESNNADPVENLMLFVESMMKERHAASKHESKWEHWLTNIQMSAQEVLKVPKTFREAVTGPEKESWIPSIKSELKSHVDNGTWRVIERRRMKNTVKMKWVFRKKINADGSIRYKSRLVVCGYSQIEGEDYFNTHAPTLSLGSLRILIAIASRFKLNLHNIDIKTAFLYGMIDADINCEIPGGIAEFLADSIANFSDPVLQLQRAIYGLKQAGYVWLQTYMRSLKSWGFKQCQTDPCVFMKRMNGRVLITAVYVDDTIIMHQSNADLNWLLKQIGKHYQFTNEGELRWALGMEVGRTTGGHYWIGQQRYIDKMKQLFEPIRKKVTTPLQSGLRLHLPGDSPTLDPTTYKRLLGSILYVAVATRPDIAFSCSYLARFSTDPRRVHYDQLLRVLQFLVDTVDHVIVFDKNDGFKGFADASLESCKKTGKSTTGYVLFYAGGPVLWRSFLQTVVADSTGEAEYMALSPLCKEVIFASQLCAEVEFPAKIPVLVFDDSEPAIAIAMGTGLTKRSRSIRLSFHNVRDCVATNTVTIEKVSGKTNPADILTKALSTEATRRYCKMFFRKRVNVEKKKGN